MKYIDIHCHLNFPNYDKDRETILLRMGEQGVGTITIGTNLESSKRAVEIARLPSLEGSANSGQVGKNAHIFACIGVHPVVEPSNQKPQGDSLGFDENEFEKLVTDPKVVAIGECGLDYFHIEDKTQKIKQKELFEKQIEFAIKHNKPLMLHCRDSYEDVLDILESYKKKFGEKLIGNAHFFTGDIQIAKRFLDIGFTVSFTGVITFTNDYDEVIKFIPQDSIMSETDAPFVAPVPHRGKRNEPSYVIEVVKKLADIRGEDEERLRKIILSNAKRIFGIE